MATLEDIARQLGVAKSTVSKALNGAGDVSEQTRRAVLEKAVEMGYTRTNRGCAPRLAVFVTNMDYTSPTDFGYDIIMGFRKLAEPAGYQVDVIPLDILTQQDIRYDEYMILRNYRGSLFLGLDLQAPWQKDFITCRTPTVLYDNQVAGNPHVTYVGVDNKQGMEQAVAHLHGLGHRKIGYLSGSMHSYIYRKRAKCFTYAMAKYNLPSGPAWMGSHDEEIPCVMTHLSRLLELGCTALVCSHDKLARAAMEACAARGLNIPADISILGFDDSPLCHDTTPALTSIRQDRTVLGKSAYYALLSQMNQVHLSTILLHTDLIQRDSCACVPL